MTYRTSISRRQYPSLGSFARKLQEELPQVRLGRVRLEGGKQVRCYLGIKLVKPESGESSETSNTELVQIGENSIKNKKVKAVKKDLSQQAHPSQNDKSLEEFSDVFKR